MMMIYPKAIALHNQEISTVGWELRKFWVFTKKRSHFITRRYLRLNEDFIWSR
ncbi:hypothetical protein [Limnospira platensis]|uniref:hypothetical protein n=1 Tax=Limnospira platensis TaxID=118562 RepID=UPI003D6DBB40